MDQQAKIFQNNRKSTRIIRKDIKVCFAKTKLIGVKETINCELLDISSTGLQISTDKKIALNSILELTLQFESGDKFKLITKSVWNKKNEHYKSKHSFSTTKDILDNKTTSLKQLNLYEDNKLIFAKFRSLSHTQVQILTDCPLNKNKQHSLVFTLSDNKTHKLYTKIESYQRYSYNCYGVSFEKPNNDLGDCLLETQTNLMFK